MRARLFDLLARLIAGCFWLLILVCYACIPAFFVGAVIYLLLGNLQ